MPIAIELLVMFCATLVITAALLPFFIVYFTNKKLGQMTREEGPAWHEVKSGTPTMGGIAFIIATTVISTLMLVFRQAFDFKTASLLFVLVSFGTIGFLDDFLKLIRQHNEGLTSKQKFVWQIVCSLVYMGLYVLSQEPMTLQVLFFSTNHVIIYGVFAVIWMTGFSNAVNLTDGLDGLVAGTASIALGAYAIIAHQKGEHGILLFCVSLIGGLVGFFLFNKKPAKIFMGDVGSLALGGVFAVLSMLLHVEWSLLLIGFVFVMETASVMLQVGSYKLRQKRIFKMSPIHHHFEMSGWSEWKVVIVFWTIGLVSAGIYLLLF